MEKDINALDGARDKAINNVFGESATVTSPIAKSVNKPTTNASLQNELFYVLEKYGFTRDQVTPIVANLMMNLTRVKTPETYKFKNI